MLRTPMRVGVISDVHADLSSLDRALDLLDDQGADRVVCCGDVVEKGPDGDGVVSRLHETLIPCVAGNHDHNAIRHRNGLAPQTLERLADFPMTRSYLWAGVRVMLAHGTLHNNQTYVFADHIPKSLKKQLRTRPADVLLLGHTHRPMQVHYQGAWLLNPGSVCQGRTRDSHTCATLDLPSLRWRVYDLKSRSVLSDLLLE